MDEARALRRVVVGVVLSLAAHALLMWAWRSGGADAYAPPPPRPLAVRLRPPPPPPPPRVETPEPPARAEPAPRAPKPTPPRKLIALPPAGQGAPDPFVVEQPPEPEPAPADTPRFDPDAARKMARSLANMRDPAREGTAIGQFPDKPLETESRAARAIGAAKRRDCKDGIPGGLLAPLILLADKKDSGCKW